MEYEHLRKKALIIITLLFAALGCIYFLYWAFYGRFFISTDDAYVRGNIIPVMPQVSGRVQAILSDETDFVKKGDKIVLLDPIDAQIALKLAKTNLALTTRQVNQFYFDVKQYFANVKLAKDNLNNASEDLKRRRGLIVNKTISAEELQHTVTRTNNAKDSLESAREKLNAAKSLIEGTDVYHHPKVEHAAAQLKDAFLNLERTTIYAPVSGYVAKRPAQVGQQINPSSVLMVLVPLEDVWIDANFKESQLKNIRIGQKVTVVTDAYGNGIVYHGHVVGLSPGTGSVFDLLPPQNATGNWIKILQRIPVRIKIDNQDLKKYPLRLGLSTTVKIDTHDRSGAALTSIKPPKILYQTPDFEADFSEPKAIIDSIIKSNLLNLQIEEKLQSGL